MNLQTGPLTRVLAQSLLVASMGLAAASPQDQPATMANVATDGKAEIKVLLENAKVKVYEVTFKPGDAAPSQLRPNRVIHYQTPGKLTRIYPDGKLEDRTFTAGDTVWIEAATYAVKNTGMTTVKLMGIELK
jgi:quercetin dioxygenase-like cupin family protein